MPAENEEAEPILNACPACGGVVDAAELIPFTKVACPHCGAAMRVRAQLGKFQILKEIGVGGMSHVFRALDTTLEREVALKVLNAENSRNPERMRAFEREARLTASVRHPHVVQLYSTGWDRDTYFLAMELVEGGSLEDRVAGGVEAASLMAQATQIVSGLRAAWRAGLLHRDIKPANILFDTQGNAKLVDFGLALMNEEADEGEMWATPWYVAPEKIAGEGETVASDIYSLGATLRHALTGEPPFPSQSMQPEELIELKRTLPPLDEEVEGSAGPVAALINRMTAFQPGERVPDYDRLAEEIVAVRAEIDERTVQLTRRLEMRRVRRRNRLIAAAAGAGLLLLVVGLLIWPHRDGGRDAADVPWGAIDEGGGAGGSFQAFSDAAKLLGEGNFTDAYIRFQRLSEDQATPPATAAWATWNGAVAAWMLGEDGAARRLLQAWSEGNRRDEEGVPTFFAPMVEAVLQPGAMPLPAEGEDPGEAAIGLLAGLEAWSVGRTDLARAWFDRFEQGAGIPPWAEGYKAFLARYREDGERWEALPSVDDLGDAAAVNAALVDLDRFARTVQTSGRMPWALEQRRRRYESRLAAFKQRAGEEQQQRLEAQERRRRESYAAVIAAARQRVEAGETDWEPVRTLLQASLEAEADAGSRERHQQWVTALGTMVAALADGPRILALALDGALWNGDLGLRDGTRLEAVTLTGSAEGTLRVRRDNQEQRLDGASLDQQSYAVLSLVALKGTRDSRRYYELLEALTWRLVVQGETEAGPESTAAEYPPFRERWELLRPLFVDG